MSHFFLSFVLDIFRAEGRKESDEKIYSIPYLLPNVCNVVSILLLFLFNCFSNSYLMEI